jgi:signal transduction histidine kinase
LGGRLVLAGALASLVAIMIAAVLIGLILKRFIVGQIDQRIDTEIARVADQLAQTDALAGRLEITEAPPYDRRGSGWYWRVTGEGVDLKSASLGEGTFEIPPPPPDWRRLLFGDRPRPSGDPDGRLHLRSVTATFAGRAVTIAATAPRSAITGPLRDALLPLAGSLAVLGAALVLASFGQVRLGLRPLRRLEAAVARVRKGQAGSIDDAQPLELRPLVEELNRLIVESGQNLIRARRQVANLAHGLKTPLATLSLELQQDRDVGRGELLQLVDAMDRRLRHHLNRARAAETRGVPSLTALAPCLRDLGEVLGKLYADRRLDIVISCPDDLRLAVDQQDLNELLGTILDNACKWARRSVRVVAAAEGRSARIAIDDDGPGVPADKIAQVLLPGRRADETVPGDGFGLAIARELAELYGGSIDLTPSGELGGLHVAVQLPAPP